MLPYDILSLDRYNKYNQLDFLEDILLLPRHIFILEYKQLYSLHNDHFVKRILPYKYNTSEYPAKNNIAPYKLAITK